MMGNREPSRSMYLDSLERLRMGRNITALQDPCKSICECRDHYSSRFALFQLKMCARAQDKIGRDNHCPITGMVSSAWTAHLSTYVVAYKSCTNCLGHQWAVARETCVSLLTRIASVHSASMNLIAKLDLLSLLDCRLA